MDGSEKRRLILLDIMNKKDISPKELSRKSGVNYTSIMQFRNGDKKLNSIPMLERLSLGLGETIAVFFPEAMPSRDAIDNMKREIMDAIRTTAPHGGGMTAPPIDGPFLTAAAHAKAPQKK